MARRVAVVLMNLGGPDGLDAVEPFLKNLFSDPAIIRAPVFVRLPLAAAIARLRGGAARRNYALMGGVSPLRRETDRQAAALEEELKFRFGDDMVRVFTSMRHWSPLTDETVTEVAAFAPDTVVLAPLYPQYSTTTSASSLKEWRRRYRGAGEPKTICCWPLNSGLIAAHADIIESTWAAAGRPSVRLLFSAHGLPKRVIGRGDPYQWQVESSCAAVAARLGPEWDWRVCYQSRVGPAGWIGPSTIQEIHNAARDGIGVIIDPIAFVSEHVETLVELDIDYRRRAEAAGVSIYLRCQAVGAHPIFIGGMADAVERSIAADGTNPDGPACPVRFIGCPASGARRPT